MELLPDEVHLAGQRSLIAFLAQVVSVGRNVAAQCSRIVPSGDLGRKLTGDEGRACGST